MPMTLLRTRNARTGRTAGIGELVVSGAILAHPRIRTEGKRLRQLELASSTREVTPAQPAIGETRHIRRGDHDE